MLNNLFFAQKGYLNVLLCVDAVIIFPILVTFICWNLCIINRIKLTSRLYKIMRREAPRDSTGYSQEQAYCYKTDYVKYWHMLVINCCELVAISLYFLGFSITEILWSYHHEYPDNLNSVNCTINLYQNFPSRMILEAPVGMVCVSIAQAANMCGLGVSTCLMRYLESRQLFPSRDTRNLNTGFIRLILVTAIIFITLGSFPQTVILHRIIEPIIQLMYYVKWIKQIRRFYQVSKSVANDYRIIVNNEQLYRMSLSGVHQFGILMSYYALGTFCLITSELLSYSGFLLSTILYYSPCLLHYLYGTPLYTPIIHSPQALDTYVDVFYSVTIICRSFMIVTFVGFTIQFLVTSLLFLINTVKSRLRPIRTRFTPSLTHPLLFQHQVDGDYPKD